MSAAGNSLADLRHRERKTLEELELIKSKAARLRVAREERERALEKIRRDRAAAEAGLVGAEIYGD